MPAHAPVTLKLADAKEHFLQPTINSLVQFEEDTGTSLTAIGGEPSLGTMRALLRACLNNRPELEAQGRRNKPFSLEEAGNLMQGIPFDVVGEAVADALQASLPGGDAQGEAEAPSTGGASSVNSLPQA